MPKIKITIGLVALLLWCLLTVWSLLYLYSFALGAALGPMEAEWLLLPSFFALLALGFLTIAYYILAKNSRKVIKFSFTLILIAPQILLVSYLGYVSTLIIAKPYFTTLVTKQINLRLQLDDLDRPVFFFSEYHTQGGLNYDPYRKYILKYPEAIFKLSKKEQSVTATIVIEYSYNKAIHFWLTKIESFSVETNRIDGSFIPLRLSKK